MYSKMPTKRKISIFFGFGWPSSTRFGTKLYIQIVGIPMGTNCAPLVADLFLIML